MKSFSKEAFKKKNLKIKYFELNTTKIQKFMIGIVEIKKCNKNYNCMYLISSNIQSDQTYFAR